MSSAPQPHKSGTFGERLRREREMRGIKLEEISESTKIGKRNLVALEEEHFDQLPGGIFNKGFVRAYAKFLGLDEEQAVNDFLAASANYEQPAALAPPSSGSPSRPAFGRDGVASRTASGRDSDPGSPAAARAAAVRTALASSNEPRSAFGRAGAGETSAVKPPAMPSDATVRRRQRLWALCAALVLVIGLALWFKPAMFGLGTLRARRESSSSQADVKREAETANARVAQASSPVANSSANAESVNPSSVSSSATTTSSPSSSSTQAKISQPEAGKGTDTNAKLAEKSSQPGTHSTQREAPRSGQAFLPHDSRKSPSPADSITLNIYATSEVWVSATSDGVSVLNFTLHSGESRQLRASNHLILKTGNAAALDVTFNGKPLPPLGKANQVRTLTFSPSGLQ